jgi:hypothetical protein
MIMPEKKSLHVIFVIFTRQTYRWKMTQSCELVATTPQVRFELFTTTILAGRRRWWPKLEGKLKHIHTWTVGAKNFGRHNGASMQALWTKRMAVTCQIFSNKACKVMNWKTLMLCCCFNLEVKWKVYNWEQWGLRTCTRPTLTSSQMILWFHPHLIRYYKTILNPSLITKIMEWALDLFHLIFY